VGLVPNLIETIKRAALDAVKASNPCAIMFGKVESISPLKINVEQRLTLGESHLILTSLVKDFEVEMTVDGVIKQYTVHLALQTGETVMLLRNQGGQQFIVLDRVVMT
jgi:hypothetical protein